MIIKSIIGTTCACLAVVSFNTSAALIERLGGLAYYDDVADLTWLANANAAGFQMGWAEANTWAAGLSVNGVDGWRLPDSDTCFGYNCTDSEMGNLFYNVLGGSVGTSITTSHNANYDLFNNIQSFFYWTATENADNLAAAWVFVMSTGHQNGFNFKTNTSYAWAVHSSDVGAVPVPAAVWLFGSGLLGLLGVAAYSGPT